MQPRFATILLILLSAGASAQSGQAAQQGPAAMADHVAIAAADAAVTAAFYRGAFGMGEVPTKLPNTRWLSMGPTMTLHIIGGRKKPASPSRVAHLALRTANLARSIAYFDAHAIPWSDFEGKPRAIQTRFDGVRQIFVQDPDGHWIEVSDALGTPQP